MTPPISHIFDHSSCLSMRQLKEYVAGAQTHEERHATEHHLNDCSLCSEAVQGLSGKKDAATNLSSTLSSNFLKQHINATHPLDHAPASHPVRAMHRRQKFTRTEGGSPVAFAPLVSAIFILCGYLLWQKPQVPTPTQHRNTARVVSPSSAPERVPEAVVIPVRHNKDEKPKIAEPEVVHIPPAEKAQIDMQKAEIASVRLDGKQPPRPVSLRPAIVEMPKKNVMTVVAGDGEADYVQPSSPDLRRQDELKPARKRELQAFQADGHAATKPEALTSGKGDPRANSKADVQALNKPEPSASHKPDIQTGPKNDAQAFNTPKVPAASVKQAEQEQEERPKGMDQYESREAAMNAARDLQKQGKDQEARQILNDLAGTSGAEKRAAKKMLRKMNNGME